MPLDRLQRDLDLGDRVNTLLVQGVGTHFVYESSLRPLTLDDLGLRTRQGPTGDTIVESRAGLITDALADADRRDCQPRSAFASTPVLTYVANAIRIGDREIPYSTVTGDRFRCRSRPATNGPDPLSG